MEILFALVVIGFIGLGSVLSIVTFFMMQGSRREIRELQEKIQSLELGAPAKPTATVPPAAEPKPEPTPEFQTPGTPAVPVARAKPKSAEDRNLEVTLGGKVASFIGIAALVLGVVFFVGVAIQRGWIGPAMRIVLGLVSGGALVALGHLAEVRGKRLTLLARVLTGGGAALFFFSVFAAYGIYQLIGATMAMGGLTLTVLAVLGLSVVYRSQTVAILGVLGAYFTPLVIGGEMTEGLFPLIYIAAVNVVVLFLGVRRNWQALYNIGFILTAVFFLYWLERQFTLHAINLQTSSGLRDYLAPGLGFAFIFFAQFVALGLVKLKNDRSFLDSTLDMGRLLASSLVLMYALHGILNQLGYAAWVGAAFLAVAVLHLVFVKVAWKWLPHIKNDVLVLIAGAVSFATLALPVQLDGIWVSLGWALEGIVLAWFAHRFGVRAFMLGGIGLGFLGLGKAIFADMASAVHDEKALFLNANFVVAMLSSLALAVQAWLWSRSPAKQPLTRWVWFENAMIVSAGLGFIVAVSGESLQVLGQDSSWAWLFSTVSLALVGLFLLIFAHRSLRWGLWMMGWLLLLLVPVKILWLDMGPSWSHYEEFPQFFNAIFVSSLVLIGLGALIAHRFQEPREIDTKRASIAPIMNIVSILAVIAVTTIEIDRAQTQWKNTAITLWLASSGLLLVFLGLRFKVRYLRITAFVVLAVTIIKVFAIDLSAMSGLIRVAALMGVGVILLVLSFVYQRIAARLGGGGAASEEGSHEATS